MSDDSRGPPDPFDQLVENVEKILEVLATSLEKSRDLSKRRRWQVGRVQAAQRALVKGPRKGGRAWTPEQRAAQRERMLELRRRRAADNSAHPAAAAAAPAEAVTP